MAGDWIWSQHDWELINKDNEDAIPYIRLRPGGLVMSIMNNGPMIGAHVVLALPLNQSEQYWVVEGIQGKILL